MRKIFNPNRVRRLIDDAIQSFAVDLRGINVLTETASGPFVVTPLIAAAAGADQVFAFSRTSRFGDFPEVRDYTMALARAWGLEERIQVYEGKWDAFAEKSHLVTNLGFVRPISQGLIQKLPKDAAISLMWETWEFRKQDLDLEACVSRNIPVLGTDEEDQRLQIFHYIGHVVKRLLYEAEIEVFRSRCLIIGSGHFGESCQLALVNAGAEVLRTEPTDGWLIKESGSKLRGFLEHCDAVIVAEHRNPSQVLGGSGIPLQWLRNSGATVIHLSGTVSANELRENGVLKYPGREVPFGFMSVTTDYVGPRPVIDLHTAGLKVGEAMIRGMRTFGNRRKAMDYALANSPGMDFPDQTAQQSGRS